MEGQSEENAGRGRPIKETNSDANFPIKLREEVGLLEGTAITIGSIIGSGIFISPKGVIENCGSVGLSLLVWVLCGLQSAVGALCYAELGVSLPGSGGDYHYLHEAFGPLPAFIFLWVSNLIFLPVTNAILSLTFAHYAFAAFFPEGAKIPQVAVQLLACSAISLLTWMNCTSVKITTKIQNAFMFGKIAALMVIIVTGITTIAQGHTKNYQDIWKGTSEDPGKIAVAFYSGTFAYSGWNTLNYITEELKSPNKNLPRAIYISVPIVTVIYVLTNIAYFSVLSPNDIHLSNAIAVTFGQKTLGVMTWTIPVFVAMSSLGGLSVHIMTASRIVFVGARNGQFPSLLSLIQSSHLSPTPSLIFMAMLSIFYLCIPDVFVLITFSTFVFSVVSLSVVIAMLYLRWKKPDLPRPIKVHIICPIVFLVMFIFLVAFPIFARPYEVLIAIAITLSSLPVYVIFIAKNWHLQSKWLVQTSYKLTVITQKLLVAVPEDQENKTDEK